MIERKKILLIILALIVVGLFLGIFFYYKKNLSGDSVVHNYDKIANSQLEKEDNKVVKEKKRPNMIVAENYSKVKCEIIKDEIEKNNCFIGLAYQEASLKNDPSYCLDIKDYTLRNDCLYRRLVITKDVKQCEKIADQNFKKRCIEDISVDKFGVRYCDKMDDDPYEKQECVDRFTAMSLGDVKKKISSSSEILIEKCNDIKTLEYSYLCEVNAIKNGRGSCNDLKDKSRRELCLSRVLYSQVKVRDDCEKIIDEKYKNVCSSIFNNINNKNYKFDDDGDGLTNDKELWINTDPFKVDTDGDGLFDNDEYNKYHTNPIEFNNKEDVLAAYDKAEKEKIGKDLTTDSDKDGLVDADEIFYGTNPMKPDTNGDGITDGNEIKNKL